MILCIGDYIQDFWTFGTATRICPEGPVPVVVPDKYNITAGGVGLVADQLQELGADVYTWWGSMSKKTRIFAGSHLICRLDEDSVKDFEPDPFPDDQLRACDCVVVSDYGKGAIFPEIAEEIIKSGKPLFVDAKRSWSMYDAPFVYWFPNELEYEDARKSARESKHVFENCIIEKRGKHGAKWGDISIDAPVSDVVDTTGAGDIFLAAFVYANMELRLTPTDCLQYANTLAGESCRHRGTYIVPKAYAQSVLYSLQPSLMSGQPIPFEDCDSIGEEGLLPPGLFETCMAAGLKEWYSRIPNLNVDQAMSEAKACIDEFEQTHRTGPLTPIRFDGAKLPGLLRFPYERINPTDCGKKVEQQGQNPNATEHHNEHKLGQDLIENPVQPKPQV